MIPKFIQYNWSTQSVNTWRKHTRKTVTCNLKVKKSIHDLHTTFAANTQEKETLQENKVTRQESAEPDRKEENSSNDGADEDMKRQMLRSTQSLTYP